MHEIETLDLFLFFSIFSRKIIKVFFLPVILKFSMSCSQIANNPNINKSIDIFHIFSHEIS